jgi:hypothetical protein
MSAFNFDNAISSAHLSVIPVPALSDNYMYLISDLQTKTAAVIDPVSATKDDKFVANAVPMKG